MASELAPVFAALGLATTPQQEQQLLQYLDLLQLWNATYNLTAVRDRQGMLTQHLADCLAVVLPMTRVLPKGRVLDVGSGGGLPGAVLAIMQPTWAVTCVDTVGKKAAFVLQVAGALGLSNLQSAHARVEELTLPTFDLITSRAFASLVDFTALTRPLLSVGGVWMAMKGKCPDAEMAQLPPGVSVFHVEQLQVPTLDAERCLIWMRPQALGACRTWGVEAKFGPSEDSFRGVCRPIAVAMGQKAGVHEVRRSQKWTAAAELQPTIPKSDRLLEATKLS